MRIVHIDNYEVCEENGKFLVASFVDYEGIPHIKKQKLMKINIQLLLT